MFDRFSQWYQRHFSDPQVVILALFLVLGVVAVILFGRMLTPVVASLIIAYLLEGGVQRLERFGLPRLISVISVFAAFMTALLFLIFGVLPMLTRQLAVIVQQLPGYIADAQEWLATLPDRYPQIVAPAEPANGDVRPVSETAEDQLIAAEEAERQLALISEEQLSRMLDNLGAELVNYGATLVSLSGVMGMVSLLVFLVLMPVLVFFFLKDKAVLVAWIRSYLPRDRALVASVWQEVDAQIGNYVRGKVLEILIVWVVTYAVFSLLNLPFAMLLSMLVGFSVIIPYIGAAVVTIPVAAVALITFGLTASFWYVMIAYAIIQALDGNVLVPILFSEVVNLHPVAIIIAVLVFGGIWGFWGIFFAIPLATLVNAVLRAWPRARPDDRPERANAEAGS
ncbi:AI-2E family transporter [Wenzhouxiangella sp. AB-CW3]|uniref:AI-2E family transporter n=1 Tax=Wenzhouxiangella sp. AB-CW3 TaxID=2771012 RepID=UPI00168B34E2|nr:AI-2E family transporter [Wenzhouxiangella sp. AB-CW3]QOC23592.1 AI-2E family transporter [Wenzhouxiangella sp. AB-CW3]